MRIEVAPGRAIEVDDLTPESFVSALQAQAPDMLRPLMNQEFLARAKNSGSGRLYKALLATTTQGGMVTREGQQAPASAADVAAGMGPMEAAMVSAGHGAEGFKTGIQKLVSDDTKDAELESKYEENQRLMEAVEEEQPLASMAGGALPYFAVPVGAVGGAARLGTRALTRALPKVGGAVSRVGTRIAPAGGTRAAMADEALTGAALGALNEGSTAAEDAIGGALGAGLAGTLFRGSGTALRRSSPEHMARLQRLKDLGYSVTPGEATRSRVSERIDSIMRKLPLTEFGAEMQSNKNQKILKRALRQAAGLPENTPLKTSSDLRKAGNVLMAEYPKAFTKSLDLDQSVRSAMDDIMAREDAIPSMVAQGMSPKPVTTWLRAQANQYSGTLSPSNFKTLWNDLNQEITRLSQGNTGNSAQLLKEVESVLVDAYRRQNGTEATQKLLDARDKYRLGRAMTETRTYARHRGSSEFKDTKQAIINPIELLQRAFPSRRARSTGGALAPLVRHLEDLQGFRESVMGPKRGTATELANMAAALTPFLPGTQPFGFGAAAAGLAGGIGRFSAPGRAMAMEGVLGAPIEAITRGFGRGVREQTVPAVLARLGAGL
jgi:hypothetical protein